MHILLSGILLHVYEKTPACKTKWWSISAFLLVLSGVILSDQHLSMQLDAVLVFAVATIATLLVISLVTVSSIIGHIRRARDEREHGVYEDKDGKATVESCAIFSARWQKVTAVVWATFGLACYTTYSVVSQIIQPPDENEQSLPMWNWLVTASWVRSHCTSAQSSSQLLILMPSHPGPSHAPSNYHSSHSRPGSCISTRCISGSL